MCRFVKKVKIKLFSDVRGSCLFFQKNMYNKWGEKLINSLQSYIYTLTLSNGNNKQTLR